MQRSDHCEKTISKADKRSTEKMSNQQRKQAIGEMRTNTLKLQAKPEEREKII